MRLRLPSASSARSRREYYACDRRMDSADLAAFATKQAIRLMKLGGRVFERE